MSTLGQGEVDDLGSERKAQRWSSISEVDNGRQP
jgi:hypothetical protein